MPNIGLGKQAVLPVKVRLEADMRQATNLANQMRTALGRASQFEGERQFSKAIRPLGRITGQADEFSKSMAASNARVIAFGASVAIINGVSQSLKALVSTTIEVEKAFAEINVVLGASVKELEAFGNGIFEVAKQTAQSFQEVSQGALEFARQGLSMEESLKRIKDALILVRLTGLDSVEAVQGLTAAVNTFKQEGITTGQVINKLSELDIKFAVSTEDLIKGIERSGASAGQAKVSFNELSAIIAVLQERTARGGAVIGNALKTIFARVQTGETLDALRGIGVEVQNAQGDILPLVTILKDLSEKMKGLSDIKEAKIIEKVAGKRQRDILINLLNDLGDSTGRWEDALKAVSVESSIAYEKNEKLNQTLAAGIERTSIAVQDLAQQLGKLGFLSGFKEFINFFEGVFSFVDRLLDKDKGIPGLSVALRGVVAGIGKTLITVGLPLVGGIILKLTTDLVRFGKDSLKTLLGLNREAKEFARLEEAIMHMMMGSDKFAKLLLSTDTQRVDKHEGLLMLLREEQALMQQMNKEVRLLVPALMRRGITFGQTGFQNVPPLTKAAKGYVPSAVNQEKSSISRGVGGARGGDKPVVISDFNYGGGKKGPIVANTGEYLIPNYKGSGGTAVFNRDMAEQHGLPRGAKRITKNGVANGYIPNYANELFSLQDLIDGVKGNSIPRGQLSQLKKGYGITYRGRKQVKAQDFGVDPSQLDELFPSATTVANKASAATKAKRIHMEISARGGLGIAAALKGGGGSGPDAHATANLYPFLDPSDRNEVPKKGSTLKFSNIQVGHLERYQTKTKSKFSTFSKEMENAMLPPLLRFGMKLIPNQFRAGQLGADLRDIMTNKRYAGVLTPNEEGFLFEAAVRTSTKTMSEIMGMQRGDREAKAPFDFITTGAAGQSIREAFGFTDSVFKADAKRVSSQSNINHVVPKVMRDLAVREQLGVDKEFAKRGLRRPLMSPVFAAEGYVPNFGNTEHLQRGLDYENFVSEFLQIPPPNNSILDIPRGTPIGANRQYLPDNFTEGEIKSSLKTTPYASAISKIIASYKDNARRSIQQQKNNKIIDLSKIVPEGFSLINPNLEGYSTISSTLGSIKGQHGETDKILKPLFYNNRTRKQLSGVYGKQFVANVRHTKIDPNATPFSKGYVPNFANPDLVRRGLATSIGSGRYNYAYLLKKKGIVTKEPKDYQRSFSDRDLTKENSLLSTFITSKIASEYLSGGGIDFVPPIGKLENTLNRNYMGQKQVPNEFSSLLTGSAIKGDNRYRTTERIANTAVGQQIIKMLRYTAENRIEKSLLGKKNLLADKSGDRSGSNLLDIHEENFGMNDKMKSVLQNITRTNNDDRRNQIFTSVARKLRNDPRDLSHVKIFFERLKKAGANIEIFDGFHSRLDTRKLTKAAQLYNIDLAKGYIPNFADPLSEAVQREQQAGLSINQIRINQDGRLRNAQNPAGLAVTNTRDEPTGRIPNFATIPITNPALKADLDKILEKSKVAEVTTSLEKLGEASDQSGEAISGERIQRGDLLTKMFAMQTVMYALTSGMQSMGEETSGAAKVFAKLIGVSGAMANAFITASFAAQAFPKYFPKGGLGGLIGGVTGKLKGLGSLATLFPTFTKGLSLAGTALKTITPWIGGTLIGFQLFHTFFKTISGKGLFQGFYGLVSQVDATTKSLADFQTELKAGELSARQLKQRTSERKISLREETQLRARDIITGESGSAENTEKIRIEGLKKKFFSDLENTVFTAERFIDPISRKRIDPNEINPITGGKVNPLYSIYSMGESGVSKSANKAVTDALDFESYFASVGSVANKLLKDGAEEADVKKAVSNSQKVFNERIKASLARLNERIKIGAIDPKSEDFKIYIDTIFNSALDAAANPLVEIENQIKTTKIKDGKVQHRFASLISQFNSSMEDISFRASEIARESLNSIEQKLINPRLNEYQKLIVTQEKDLADFQQKTYDEYIEKGKAGLQGVLSSLEPSQFFNDEDIEKMRDMLASYTDEKKILQELERLQKAFTEASEDSVLAEIEKYKLYIEQKKSKEDQFKIEQNLTKEGFVQRALYNERLDLIKFELSMYEKMVASSRKTKDFVSENKFNIKVLGIEEQLADPNLGFTLRKNLELELQQVQMEFEYSKSLTALQNNFRSSAESLAKDLIDQQIEDLKFKEIQVPIVFKRPDLNDKTQRQEALARSLKINETGKEELYNTERIPSGKSDKDLAQERSDLTKSANTAIGEYLINLKGSKANAMDLEAILVKIGIHSDYVKGMAADITKEYNLGTKEARAQLAVQKERQKLLKEEADLRAKGIGGQFEIGFNRASKAALERSQEFYELIGQEAPEAFKDGMVTALTEAMNGAKSLKESLRDAAITFLQIMQRRFMESAADNLFAAFSNRKNKASGGLVTGGSGVRDDLPHMLMGGEYVVKKAAVQKYGVDFLSQINQSSTPQMGSGGLFKMLLGGIGGASMSSSAAGGGAMQMLMGMGVSGGGNSKGLSIDNKDQLPKMGSGGLFKLLLGGIGGASMSSKAGGEAMQMLMGAGMSKGMSGKGLSINDKDQLPKMASGGFFLPGFRGQGEIRGVDDLQKFAEQRMTSGSTDMIYGMNGRAGIDLEPQSRRLTQFGLRRGSPMQQATRDAQTEALRLVDAKLEHEKAEKEKDKQFYRQLIVTAISSMVSYGMSDYSQPAATTATTGAASMSNATGSTNYVRMGNAGSGLFENTPTYNFDYMPRRAKGGSVRGNSALLMGGEFIMSPKTVQKYGKSFFDDLNGMSMPKFAMGGMVGSSGMGESSGKGDVNIQININKDGSSSTKSQGDSEGSDMNMAKKIQSEVVRIIEEEKRLGGALSNRSRG